jgi:hypothetical protein
MPPSPNLLKRIPLTGDGGHLPSKGDGRPGRARRSCVHWIEIEARLRTRGSALVDRCRTAHRRFARNDWFLAHDTPRQILLQGVRRELVGAQR